MMNPSGAMSSTANEHITEEDRQLRREELAIRRAELRLSTRTTVLVALLSAALGGAATALIQGTTTREVEQKRFEAQLVLKMIETGDTKKSAKNLLFLVQAGFIQDPDGKISALARDPQTVPVLPRRDGGNGNGNGNGDGGSGDGGDAGDGGAGTAVKKSTKSKRK